MLHSGGGGKGWSRLCLLRRVVPACFGCSFPMLLAVLCCGACCGTVSSVARVLGVIVLDSFHILCCSLSLFLSDLPRVVGVVLVLFLGRAIDLGLILGAGVLSWADGQLAINAPLLCGGSVFSCVTVGELSSSGA